jgi:hypothetical protein
VNLLVHNGRSRDTLCVHPFGYNGNLFYEMAWVARRDSSRLLAWARLLLWARPRSATFTAPPVIRFRPRARLGVAPAGSATRDRSRSRSNKTYCIVAYDMVLIS